MPCPTRQYANVGAGLPLLRHEEYFIEHILSGPVSLASRNRVDFTVRTIQVVNQTVSSQEIDAAERYASVSNIWDGRNRLPGDLPELLDAHKTLVQGGNQISVQGRRLVQQIQAATAQASADGDVGWASPGTDPVPALLDLLAYGCEEAQFISIEQIAPEHPEIRRREIARQRRMAAARGPEANRFRRQVRNAYRSTCIVCGLQLPALWEGGKAGVDAAHILPDSEFDLNHVTNGICLCKVHHWALDEGLIEIRHDTEAGYSIAIPDEAAARAAGPPLRLDLRFLHPFIGPIPEERLPSNRKQRPNPECLRRLHELLYP